MRFLLLASLVFHATAAAPAKNNKRRLSGDHSDDYLCEQDCPSDGLCQDGGLFSDEDLPGCEWGHDCDDCPARAIAHLKGWWDAEEHWYDVDWHRFAPDRAHKKHMDEKLEKAAPWNRKRFRDGTTPDSHSCEEACKDCTWEPGSCATSAAECYSCDLEVELEDFCAHHPLVDGCGHIWSRLVTCEAFTDDATTAHMGRAICAKKAEHNDRRRLNNLFPAARPLQWSKAPVQPVGDGDPAGADHWEEGFLTNDWTSTTCRAAKIPEGVSEHDLVSINAYAEAIGEPACPSDHFLALPNPYLPPCMCESYGKGVFDTVEGMVDAFHDGTTMCVKMEEMLVGDHPVKKYLGQEGRYFFDDIAEGPYGSYLYPFEHFYRRKLSGGHRDDREYEETRVCYKPHTSHAKPHHHVDAEHGHAVHHDAHGHHAHIDEEHRDDDEDAHDHGWEYNFEGCRSDASTCAHVHTCIPYFMTANKEVAGADCKGGPTNLHPTCTFHCEEGYEFEWGGDTYDMGCEFDGDFHRCDLGGWCDWPEPPRCHKTVEPAYAITDEDGRMCDPEHGEVQILTKDACEEAARALQLKITEADEYPNEDRPSGCYAYFTGVPYVSPASTSQRALIWNPVEGKNSDGGKWKDRSVICHKYVWKATPNTRCSDHHEAMTIRDEAGTVSMWLDDNICEAAAKALEIPIDECDGSHCEAKFLKFPWGDSRYMEGCYIRDPPYYGKSLWYNYKRGNVGSGDAERSQLCHVNGPVYHDGPGGDYDPLWPMNLWSVYGDELYDLGYASGRVWGPLPQNYEEPGRARARRLSLKDPEADE